MMKIKISFTFIFNIVKYNWFFKGILTVMYMEHNKVKMYDCVKPNLGRRDWEHVLGGFYITLEVVILFLENLIYY